MDNIRKEFIKEILETLKIPVGAFNVGTVADEIKHISDTDLRAFHKALFGTDHSFLNGMDRIIKVAEQFKPVNVDLTEIKAKELIDMCHGINNKVFEDAKMSGRTFDDQMAGTIFKGLNESDLAILNQVKPYCEHKQLFSNINRYATGLEQLSCFKRAIIHSNTYSGALENMKAEKQSLIIKKI